MVESKRPLDPQPCLCVCVCPKLKSKVKGIDTVINVIVIVLKWQFLKS